MGLILVVIAVFVVTWVCIKQNEEAAEREERRKRENYNHHPRRSGAMSNNLPILRNNFPVSGTNPYLASLGYYNTPTILTTSPKTEIARFSPNRAAKVLERQFLLNTSVDLASSSAVTEFAAQGRGSHIRITHRKGFLGLKVDEIEFSIRPF